jgi:hypothetical protein
MKLNGHRWSMRTSKQESDGETVRKYTLRLILPAAIALVLINLCLIAAAALAIKWVLN